ncbi:spore photoproduct lyase family protein [Chroococcus sp. FPU101]|uniref:spore photoproduct lyase family protein n=1 Tax=Chroococcus sp. FPU101 TaxID=1974212 RepID=UPI001AA741DF|nr:radical SAM protein [Chroococcus sp. FPU101]GFE71620.1 spore photoproduct lyase [Chroococcus sp. FPU101]
MLAENTVSKTRLWMPERVLFTPTALDESWGQQILKRVESLQLPVEKLTQNRLSISGDDEQEIYRTAKRTLAVVTAPPSSFKLSPIPPSADWQFHLAQGCPAHCQYCYLAGSLQGPPVIRAYANLSQILENLKAYANPSKVTSYEVSCYTDPLGIEHLTGSLAECIRFFGSFEEGHLRWVSKFDDVDELLDLPHNNHTRCRMSVNAAPISSRFEGGTASVKSRLEALRRLALSGYPVGLVIAPIMPMEDWELHYQNLFDTIATTLYFECDLTFELITHRFTSKSKETLETWYPNSKLDMDEATRSLKRNKFGGSKYVYDSDTMKTMRRFFEQEISKRFPQAKILYWT